MKLLTLHAEPNQDGTIDYHVEYGSETEKEFKDEKYKDFLTDEVISAFVDAMNYNKFGYEVDKVIPLMRLDIGNIDDKETMPLMLKESTALSDAKKNLSEARDKFLTDMFLNEIGKLTVDYLETVNTEITIAEEEAKNA